MEPVTIGLLAGAGAGLLGTIFGNRASAKAAKENRDFQERMSNTAHQREVQDLLRAGLNPVLSANRGASSPSGSVAEVRDPGEGASRGIASALAIAQLKSQIELTQASAQRERSAAQLQGIQASALRDKTPLEMALLQGQIRVADLTAAEKQAVVPTLAERARAEIESMLASGKQTRALAALNELEKTRYKNIEQFERDIGSKGPAVRLLLEVLRTAAPYRER